jgi:hypothetical protein
MNTCDIARTMSLFEIDQALDLLIESAAEQACGPEGEIAEDLRAALAEYVEVFGEKVDRIANYIKAQEAFAETAKKEACRLETRRKAAENRAKACKSFLCWFMRSRSLKYLRGRLNTFTLAENSAAALIIDQLTAVPQAFVTVVLSLPWPRWEELLAYIPEGTLLDELRWQASHASNIDRARVSEALKAGQAVPGARLSSGQHIRLR